MAVRETVKSKLQSNLNDFSALTRQMLEVVVSDVKSTGASQQSQLSTVLDKLIERDKEIQQLTETALEMRSRQKEINRVDAELERRSQEIRELQSRLQDAEKILELAVYHGKQKLESIKQANAGAVSPEELIRYSHRISLASSAVSPVGWQPSDSRRPFPQDREMRSGFLGQLTSPMMGEDSQAPAEKMSISGAQSKTSGSRGFTGVNQNKQETVPSSQGFHSRHSGAQGGLSSMVFGEAETMSEDSSSSSSDEGT